MADKPQMDFKTAEQVIGNAITEKLAGRTLTDEREAELARAVAFLLISIPRSLASLAADQQVIANVLKGSTYEGELRIHTVAER